MDEENPFVAAVFGQDTPQVGVLPDTDLNDEDAFEWQQPPSPPAAPPAQGVIPDAANDDAPAPSPLVSIGAQPQPAAPQQAAPNPFVQAVQQEAQGAQAKEMLAPQAELPNPFVQAVRGAPADALPKPASRTREQGSYLGNIGAGAVERAGDLGAGFVRMIDGLADQADSVIPLGGVIVDENGLRAVSSQALRDYIAEDPSRNPLRQMATALDGVDLGYDANRTTDDPWNALTSGNIGTIMQWGLEQGLVSTADMAGALLNPVAYGIALSGDMAQQRAENDGRTTPDATDLAVGAVLSPVTVVLERAAAKGIISPQRAAQMFGEGAAKFLGRNGVTRAGAAALTEATTEFFQEGAQTAATSIGTQLYQDMSAMEQAGEIGKAATLGAVAGGVTGGAIGGAVEGVGASARALARRGENEPPDEDPATLIDAPDDAPEMASDAEEEAVTAQQPPAAPAPPQAGMPQDVNISFNLGPKRPNPPQSTLLTVASTAARAALGPGATVEVYSGTENDGERNGSHRHGTGLAGDMRFYKPDGTRVQIGSDEHNQLVRALAQSGAMGLGFGSEYMGDGIHVDLVGSQRMNGGRGGNIWGSGGKAMSEELLPMLRRNQSQGGGVSGTTALGSPAGIDNYAERLMAIESGGRSDAANPRSSALGRFQFVDDTWMSYVRRDFANEVQGMSDAQILDLRRDPRFEKRVFDAFTNDNALALERAELPVLNATLGMLHRFGPARGVELIKLARENPDAPLENVLSQQVIAQNPDLKGQTAKEIVDWYEQKLGQGNGFTPGASGAQTSNLRLGGDPLRRPGTVRDRDISQAENDAPTVASPRESDIGAFDVQSRNNPKGIPLRDLTTPQVTTALSERFYDNARQEFPTTPVSTVQAVAELLDTGMSRRGEPSSQGAINVMRDLARGQTGGITPQLREQFTPAQLRRISRNVLEGLGYSPTGIGRDELIDVATPPAFATDVASPLPRPEMESRIIDTLAQGDPTSLDASGRDLFRNIFSEAKSELAAARGAAQQTANDPKAPAKAKRRAQAQLRATDKLAKEMDAALRGIETLSRERKTAAPGKGNAPSPMTDRAAARAVATAITSAKSVAPRLPKSTAIAGVGRVGGALRAYAREPVRRRTASLPPAERSQMTPAAYRQWQTEQGVSSQPFYAELEQIAARMPTSQVTRDVAALRSRERQTIERNKSAIEKTAETRDSVYSREEVDRALKLQQAQIAWRRKVVLEVGAEQLRREQKATQRITRTALEVIQGAPPTAEEVRRAEKMLGRGDLGPLGRRVVPQLLSLLPVRSVDRFYGHVFNPLRVGYKRMSPIQAVITAKQVGNEIQTTMVQDGNETIAKARENLEATENATLANKEVADFMNRATAYEAFLVDPDTGGFVDVREEATKLANADPADPPKVVNDHFGGVIPQRVLELYDQFEAAPEDVRDATRRLMLAYKRALDAVMLQVVNNARNEYGLDPLNKLDTSAAVLIDTELATKLPDEERQLIQRLFARTRSGNFKPLRRSGEFAVYAEQPMQFRAATRADAIAAFNAARKDTIGLLPANRTRTPEAAQEKDGYVVNAQISYFKLFDTKAKADEARALLDRLSRGEETGLTDQTLIDFRPDPTTIRDVQLNTQDAVRGVLGINDAESGALMRLAGDNLDVRNALIAMLPHNRVSESLKTRDNILGMSDDALGDYRDDITRMSMQAAFLKSRPEVARVFSEMEAQRDAATGWVKDRQTQLINYLRNRENLPVRSAQMEEINSRLAKMSMFWFLAGPSHIAMNITQVPVFGIPQFAAKYGTAAAGDVLARSVMRSLRAVSGIMTTFVAKKGWRDPNTVVDYYGESAAIDTRFFDQLDEMPEWSAVANQPFAGDQTFQRDVNTLDTKVLFLSEYEFDQLREGKIDLQMAKVLSNARRGGHLGSIFQEEMQKPMMMDTRLSIDTTKQSADAGISWIFRFTTLMGAGVIEYANRRAVVEATLDMERRGWEDPKSTDDALLADVENVAQEMNARINVDYSTANRSTIGRRAGVLMQFTTFPMTMMLESMAQLSVMMNFQRNLGYTRREAFVAGIGTFGTATMFAGAIGATPFALYATIQAVAYMAAAAFGEDDETLGDIERWGLDATIRKKVIDLFGEDAAQYALDGVFPAAMEDILGAGPDLRLRMGVNQPPIGGFDGTLFGGEEGFNELIVGLAGPVVAMAGKGLQAAADMTDKDGKVSFGRAIEAMAPKIVSDPLRSYRYGETGLTDKSGKVILPAEDLPASAQLLRAIGFSSIQEGDVWEARNLEYEDVAKRKKKVQAANRALYERDFSEFAKRVREINRMWPQNPLTSRGVRSSYKSRIEQESTARRTGGLKDQQPDTTRAVRGIYPQ